MTAGLLWITYFLGLLPISFVFMVIGIKYYNYPRDPDDGLGVVLVLCSLLWPLAIPVSIVIGIVYLIVTRMWKMANVVANDIQVKTFVRKMVEEDKE